MAEKRVQRRLAAILAADVVGFSRLMERDEAGTLDALKSRRQAVLSPVVAQHNGRVVKLMGDGVLAEFASAVDAVQCAVELQKGFTAANQGIPEALHIVLRIGINLGDVIVEGSDLYGDGVNIAARIESIAEPGGIYMSHTVYDQVRRKLVIDFDDVGPQMVKNIAEPLHVYRIRPTENPSSKPLKFQPSSGKPSVAILPFDNMSNEPDQDYFSDGITEDIITELSRFGSLSVMARNSSFAFRGQSLGISEIGSKLGVEYVVEGSIRKSGNRVRITAQLIEVASGMHAWSERYDRSLEDIFAVQDEVARVIASTVSGQVERDIANRAARKAPGSFVVYDYVLRGIRLHQTLDRQATLEAQGLFEEAIRIDPHYAEAHSWLALCHVGYWDIDRDDDSLKRALSHAKAGVRADENGALCHIVLGFVYLFLRQFESAEHHHNRAISLNPNHPHFAAHMGFLMACTGRVDQSAVWFEKALQLNPVAPPSWYFIMMSIAAFVERRYDITNKFARHLKEVEDYMYLIAANGHLGDIPEAANYLSRYNLSNPNLPILERARSEPFAMQSDFDHLVEGLQKAGA